MNRTKFPFPNSFSGNKQQKDAYKNSDLVLLSKATQLPALFCILPLALDILEIG